MKQIAQRPLGYKMQRCCWKLDIWYAFYITHSVLKTYFKHVNSCLHVCMYHAPCAHESQKWVSRPLPPKLQIDMSHHVNSGVHM